MDSFLDIGWRIGLGLLLIGGVLLFIQRRNESNPKDEFWVQEPIEGDPNEHDNRPKVAPSVDIFE